MPNSLKDSKYKNYLLAGILLFIFLLTVGISWLVLNGGFAMLEDSANDDTEMTGMDSAPESTPASNSSNAADIVNSIVNPSESSDESQTSELSSGNLPAGTEVDYTISMFNFGYSPSQITASPGDTLVLELVSEDGSHDFVIDSLNVSSEILTAGDSTIISVQIPEDADVGNYEFYCSVGSHRALGMEGILTIR